MDIREIEKNELLQLLELYAHLHENEIPAIDGNIESLWAAIMKDPNHHIVVGMENHKIVSSCVVVVVLNLTHNQRPYALVENVITHPDHRGKGYATQVLDFAKAIANENRCYKVMLMTGSKKAATLNFYGRAGYNKNDKTAFIQWLE